MEKEKSMVENRGEIVLYQPDADYKEFVISKQIFRSGTSIGANLNEAKPFDKLRVNANERLWLIRIS